MVTKIQKVAQSAYKIFSRLCTTGETHISSENVGLLTGLMNEIKDSDVNFDITKIPSSSAPVSYMELYEDQVMTMAIFIIRKGFRIPLHDHPKMYGFCKVIHGTALLQSYSNVVNFDQSPPDDILSRIRPMFRQTIKPVLLHEKCLVGHAEDSCVITPEYGTYHELSAPDGPVAFLDILAPSYDHSLNGERICQYYKELESQTTNISHQGKPVTWLIPVGQPDEFWCDHSEYEGPVIHELNDQPTEDC